MRSFGKKSLACPWFLGALVLFAGISCQQVVKGRSGCSTDEGCSSDEACVARTCLPRAQPRVFDIRFFPEAASTSAETEIPSTTLEDTRGAFVLSTRVRTAIRVAPSDLLGSADQLNAQPAEKPVSVRVELPSLIAGASPLVFTGPVIGGLNGDRGTALLSIPADRMAASAQLTVTPPLALARRVPGQSLSIELAPLIDVALPGISDVESGQGELTTALDEPAPGYETRVIQGGRVVSNRDQTDAEGLFRLLIPKEALASGAPPLALLVSPPSPGAQSPALLVSDFELLSDRRTTLKLPAFQASQRVRIPVIGTRADGASQMISGLLISAATTFEPAIDGGEDTTAQPAFSFQSAAQTSAEGVATLRLLPGNASSPRPYQLDLRPPTNSRWAPKCVRDYAFVGSPSGLGTPTAAAISLEELPRLQGIIETEDGEGLSGVRVTARAQPPGQATSCSALPNPLSTQTDSLGRFTLHGVPGTYRLAIEPPQSSPHGRALQDVAFLESETAAVVLPRGEVVSGSIINAEGNPERNCLVEILEPQPNAPPVVVARALSDVTGRFRAVAQPLEPARP